MWYCFVIQITVGSLWISTKNSIPYTKLSTYFWSCHQSFSTQWKLLTIWYPLSVLKSTASTMVSDTCKFSKPTNQIINLSQWMASFPKHKGISWLEAPEQIEKTLKKFSNVKISTKLPQSQKSWLSKSPIKS